MPAYTAGVVSTPVRHRRRHNRANKASSLSPPDAKVALGLEQVDPFRQRILEAAGRINRSGRGRRRHLLLVGDGSRDSFRRRLPRVNHTRLDGRRLGCAFLLCPVNVPFENTVILWAAIQFSG